VYIGDKLITTKLSCERSRFPSCKTKVQLMNRRRRNNKGIATWLKWLLGIMAVGFVLCLATCGTIAWFGYQEIQKMVDPGNIKKVIAEMATVKELPPTYKYAFGMDMFGMMPMAAVQNESTKTTYMLIRVPNTDGKVTSAEQLVEQIAERGVPTASSSGSQSTTTIEVKEKGKTTVGGLEMPYILGTSENKSTGKRSPAFMGCVLPTPDAAVTIYAANEDDKPIDMNEVNAFLSNITAFSKDSAFKTTAPATP
jgi:hypothetical protein